MVDFDAVVLAGGTARRLGGVDKPALLLDGRPLLDHVLAAVAGADRIVVVGPERPSAVPVIWRRESPPGGGPVAAIAAALPDLTAPYCVVVAADLPRIAPAVPVLTKAIEDHDAAVLVSGGRVNYLAAAWRTDALRAAIANGGDPAGAAARTLYAGHDIVEVTDAGGWGRGCDTWADFAALGGQR